MGVNATATLVRTPREVRDGGWPGAFCYTGEGPGSFPGGIVFACPCGCGDVSGIPIGTDPAALGPAWLWDGNREAPTLTPSLLKSGGTPRPGRPAGCGWHGWLRAGEFESD